jgi:hypothetical protein
MKQTPWLRLSLSEWTMVWGGLCVGLGAFQDMHASQCEPRLRRRNFQGGKGSGLIVPCLETPLVQRGLGVVLDLERVMVPDASQDKLRPPRR